MNDDSSALLEEFDMDCVVQGDDFTRKSRIHSPVIPAYLEETYWWAYLRPGSIWLFEREWLVNLILWGNMQRLIDAVIDELDCRENSAILQVACVYGDLSNCLATHLDATGSHLHVLDVADIQLQNTRKKLAHHNNASMYHQDSRALYFTRGSFEHTVVFFLLHEQPADVRRKTISEAIRVTRPGGKVIFVDYHGPKRSNPLRYLMHPVLKWLEPYALDLWREELPEFLPEGIDPERISVQTYFGGLYQKMIIRC